MTEPVRTRAVANTEKQAKSTNAAKASKTSIDTVRMAAAAARETDTGSTARKKTDAARKRTIKQSVFYCGKPYD
jgi:hypothetical protein